MQKHWSKYVDLVDYHTTKNLADDLVYYIVDNFYDDFVENVRTNGGNEEIPYMMVQMHCEIFFEDNAKLLTDIVINRQHRLTKEIKEGFAKLKEALLKRRNNVKDTDKNAKSV